MEKELKVVGKLSERDHRLITEITEKQNRLIFDLGRLELRKSELAKEISDSKHSLKVEEHKIVKKYGEKAILDFKTGEIKVAGDYKPTLEQKVRQAF